MKLRHLRSTRAWKLSTKARNTVHNFFVLWYDLISLERLKFLMNLLLALLTAKGTSLKWFSMKISGMSYKSTHVSSLRTFNREPSFSLLRQKLS